MDDRVTGTSRSAPRREVVVSRVAGVRAAHGASSPRTLKRWVVWGAWVPAVAAACPTCAREESPLRAWLVVAMMVAPLVVGAVAAFVLSRSR
jgi:hypothetical protein